MVVVVVGFLNHRHHLVRGRRIGSTFSGVAKYLSGKLQQIAHAWKTHTPPTGNYGEIIN